MPRFLRLKALVPAAVCAGLLLVSSLGAQAQTPPEGDEAKSVYGLGFLFGRQLHELSMSESEIDQFLDGMRDQALNNPPQVDIEAQMMAIQAFVQSRTQQGQAQLNTEDQEAFVAGFMADGGTLTPSGLAYKIIEPGSGDKPAATDTVEVHYEGRLIDGTVFDSSYQRDSTATFGLNQVIPGWTEGLQLIAPGGKVQLVIPSDLGYGERGSPPTIPGGATLVFDVELIDIK